MIRVGISIIQQSILKLLQTLTKISVVIIILNMEMIRYKFKLVQAWLRVIVSQQIIQSVPGLQQQLNIQILSVAVLHKL